MGRTRTKKRRRAVDFCRGTPSVSKGGPLRLWAYSVHSLADFLGLDVDVVRYQLLKRPRPFDPGDLADVMRYRAELEQSGRVRMRAIGAPTTVYIAAASGEAAVIAGQWVASSLPACIPVVIPGDGRTRHVARGIEAIARSCDKVVAWEDPILAGRPDVVAASRAGVPVILIDEPTRVEIAQGADPWDRRFQFGRSMLAFSAVDA